MIKVAMMTKQKGYILFITFSMLALCTALVSVFMVKGITHKRLSSALLEQEQLSQFAMSTVAIGQSFLSFSAEDLKAPVEDADKQPSVKIDEQDENSEKGKPLDINKALLEKLVPVLGQSQEIKFEEIEKDFPLVINLIFFAESGKININGLYDLVSKKFYDEGIEGKDRKIFATWLFEKIAKITEKPSLLQPFVEHMKQRKAPLNDVTELLVIKEFSDCFEQAVFYGQQSKAQESKSKDKDKKSKKLFLTDLFTVACENDTIQPWLLSPSVCALLDMAQKNDKKDKNDILDKKEEKIDLSSFKQQQDWQKDWDAALKPLYGVSYDKIPESVRGILAPSFQATVFSVLASVFNENMTVQVFAILKQKRLPDGAVVYDVIKTYQV